LINEGFNIYVRAFGALGVQRDLNRIGRAGQEAAGSVDTLRRALYVFGGAVTARAIVGVADNFTNLQNRLSAVTDGVESLNQANRELFEVAARTRTSFGAVVALYSRVGLAAQDLGLTQSELADFVESVSQAAILSGASVTEAAAGFTQLSQGLASGQLRGDELRSVLEQIPVVADVVAEEMGTVRGRLREFAEQGLISSEIVISAFANMADELDERFARTIPTIGQSIQVLGNSVLFVVGSFAQASGIANAVASTLLSFASNVYLVETALGILASTITIALVRVAIPALIAAFVSLNSTMRANPFVFLASAVAAAAIALRQYISIFDGLLAALSRTRAFGQAAFAELSISAQAAGQSMVGISQAINEEVTRAAQNVISTQTQTADIIANVTDASLGKVAGIAQEKSGLFAQAFKTAFDFVGQGIADISDYMVNALRSSFDSTQQAVAVFADKFVQNIVGAARSAIAALNQVPTSIARSFLEAFNTASASIETAINNIINGLNRIPLFDNIENVQFSRIGEEFLSQTRTMGDEIREAFESAQDLTPAQDLLRAGEEFIERVRARAAQTALPDMTLPGYETIEIAAQSMDDLNISTDLASSATSGAAGAQEQLSEQLSETAKMADLTKTRMDALANMSISGEVSFVSSLSSAFDSFNDGLHSMAEDIEGTLSRTFKAAEDIIFDFVSTGKASFGDFATSVVNDLLRISIRQNIVNPLSGILGGLVNGVSSMFGGGGKPGGGLFGFNTGGTFAVGGNPGIDRNTLSLNGAPIAKVSRGEMIDVKSRGNISNGPTVVQYNTFNVYPGVEQTVQQEIMRYAPDLQKATIEAIKDNNARGIN